MNARVRMRAYCPNVCCHGYYSASTNHIIRCQSRNHDTLSIEGGEPGGAKARKRTVSMRVRCSARRWRFSQAFTPPTQIADRFKPETHWLRSVRFAPRSTHAPLMWRFASIRRFLQRTHKLRLNQQLAGIDRPKPLRCFILQQGARLFDVASALIYRTVESLCQWHCNCTSPARELLIKNGYSTILPGGLDHVGSQENSECDFVRVASRACGMP